MLTRTVGQFMGWVCLMRSRNFVIFTPSIAPVYARREEKSADKCWYRALGTVSCLANVTGVGELLL